MPTPACIHGPGWVAQEVKNSGFKADRDHPWPMMILNVIINAVTPTLHSGNWLSSLSSLTPQIGIMKMLSFPGSEARGGGCPVPTNPSPNPPASVCQSAAGRAMTDSWASPLRALVPVPCNILPPLWAEWGLSCTSTVFWLPHPTTSPRWAHWEPDLGSSAQHLITCHGSEWCWFLHVYSLWWRG